MVFSETVLASNLGAGESELSAEVKNKVTANKDENSSPRTEATPRVRRL